MAQLHWDPATCLDVMREEVPQDERLQSPSLAWAHRDLAVIVATLPATS